MSNLVHIISYEEKISKKGNSFVVLKLMNQSGASKDFITNKDDLEKIGFKTTYLSDLTKLKLVPIEADIDPFPEFPRIKSLKPVT